MQNDLDAASQDDLLDEIAGCRGGGARGAAEPRLSQRLTFTQLAIGSRVLSSSSKRNLSATSEPSASKAKSTKEESEGDDEEVDRGSCKTLSSQASQTSQGSQDNTGETLPPAKRARLGWRTSRK